MEKLEEKNSKNKKLLFKKNNFNIQKKNLQVQGSYTDDIYSIQELNWQIWLC